MKVYLVRAFGFNANSGNPAGVVIDADSFGVKERQDIAAKAGYSETAFISRSAKHDFKIQFFTPTKEIDNCGHATVAAFSLLQSLGRLRNNSILVENNTGTFEVFIEKDGRVFMKQKAPIYEDIGGQRGEFLDAIGLKSAIEPWVVSTGNRFFVCGVNSENELKDVRPNQEMISKLSEKHKLIGYYVFTKANADAVATTRMFAPFYGIPEESATGMAAGPLGCLLFDKLNLKQSAFTIEQGQYMNPPSPSKIEIVLQGDPIQSLLVGGRAYVS